MMTLKFDGDFFDLLWADLREVMAQDEKYRCQLLANDGNVNELRRELMTERPDLVKCLDSIADDWTTIRWRIASIVLLERVSDLDAFCAAAHDAMAGDAEAIKRLVKLLKGVDDAERAYWENSLNPPTPSPPPLTQLVATKTITLPGGVKIELLWCPATTSDEWKRISGGKDYFLMGSPNSETERYDDETHHRVKLTKGFWMGETPVTQGQWKAVMGENPSDNKSGDNYPVENVSWDDCQEFLKKLNAKAPSGWRFALPTEAQWEYACWAGSTGTYGGTEQLDDMGWYIGNSGNHTHAVAQKKPNPWGLYDMHGNVCEWCSDWFGGYPPGVATNPKGRASGGYRVLRGGSYWDSSRNCRPACRFKLVPGIRSRSTGLRLSAFHDGR